MHGWKGEGQGSSLDRIHSLQGSEMLSTSAKNTQGKLILVRPTKRNTNSTKEAEENNGLWLVVMYVWGGGGGGGVWRGSCHGDPGKSPVAEEWMCKGPGVADSQCTSRTERRSLCWSTEGRRPGWRGIQASWLHGHQGSSLDSVCGYPRLPWILWPQQRAFPGWNVSKNPNSNETSS